MCPEDLFDLKKFQDPEFSPIAWLNNTIRLHNKDGNISLPDTLKNISNNCNQLLSKYYDYIERDLDTISSSFEKIKVFDNENTSMLDNLKSRIYQFKKDILSSGEFYDKNESIDNILILYDQKIRLETALQLLKNSSKFESMLLDIEEILKNKENIKLIINNDGQGLQDITNKFCSLKLLVSSLESLPEFFIRIEKFHSLENKILHYFDEYIEEKFIRYDNFENITIISSLYENLGQNPRLEQALMNIFTTQAHRIWELIWSFTSYGSQKFEKDENDNMNIYSSPRNKSMDNLIIFEPIQDLQISEIGHDIYRIREDEAVIKYFRWFHELILARRNFFKDLFTRDSNYMKILHKFYRTLVETCIHSLRQFINFITQPIKTTTNFSFNYGLEACIETKQDNIFSITYDGLTLSVINDIRTVCQRMYKSFEISMQIIQNCTNSNLLNDVTDTSQNNSVVINEIYETIFKTTNILFYLFQCDVMVIIRGAQSLSPFLNTSNNIVDSLYSLSEEVLANFNILADTITRTFLSESNLNENIYPTPFPKDGCVIQFIVFIDQILTQYLHYCIQGCMNPFQNAIRSINSDLVKKLGYKLKYLQDYGPPNLLDKELLKACIKFYFCILDIDQLFGYLLRKLLNHCQEIYQLSEYQNPQIDQYVNSLSMDINIADLNIIRDVNIVEAGKLANIIFDLMSKRSNNLEEVAIEQFYTSTLIKTFKCHFIDIIAQCCSYPIMALLENYCDLEQWTEKLDFNIHDQLNHKIINNSDLSDNDITEFIRELCIQPSLPVVTSGEYILSIVVSLESNISNYKNSDTNSLVTNIVYKIAQIMEDTYRRQIIAMDKLNYVGLLQIFVELRYISSVFEILCVCNKNQLNSSWEQDFDSLSSALSIIVKKLSIKQSSDKKTLMWYDILIQKFDKSICSK
ncbi:hypothetical protein cand_018080 [Cryptosporidium andersoni]|uniref:Uncharacterized protein n=1 Tax=Cryptosporidium andersoni TaxID=117008 RepID=A0A1J4MKZ0_9CRYT|nr:hypothetical protein cand_018080 [Cryptosporidium andersoni]